MRITRRWLLTSTGVERKRVVYEFGALVSCGVACGINLHSIGFRCADVGLGVARRYGGCGGGGRGGGRCGRY